MTSCDEGIPFGLNIDTAASVLGSILSSPLFPVVAAAVAFLFNVHLTPAFILFLVCITIFVLFIHHRHCQQQTIRRIDWSKHTVLLTGGCHGIGLCLLRRLLATNSIGCIAVIDIVDLPSDIRCGVHLYKCDLADAVSLEQTIELIQCEMGPITILINNAGTICPMLVSDQSSEQINRVMGVNALAPMHITRILLRDMLRCPHAHIVFVSSVMAFLGVPQVATYNASKAALAIFHESLRLEIENHLGASHVRTSAVFPSMVETGMFNGVRMPRWISPELPPKLVAQRIFDQIESGCDGDIYLPLFTNIAPVYMLLPRIGRELIHWIGGSIDAMRTFRGYNTEPNISM